MSIFQFVCTDKEIEMTFPTIPNTKIQLYNIQICIKISISYIHNQQTHLHICTHLDKKLNNQYIQNNSHFNINIFGNVHQCKIVHRMCIYCKIVHSSVKMSGAGFECLSVRGELQSSGGRGEREGRGFSLLTAWCKKLFFSRGLH